jgi:signal transduction histidine kinase
MYRIPLLTFSLLIFFHLPLSGQSEHFADSLLVVAQSKSTSESKLAYLDSVCGYYKNTYRPGGAALFQLRKELINPQVNFKSGLNRMNQTGFYYMRTGEMDLAREEIDFYFNKLSQIEERTQKAGVFYSKSYLEEQVQNNELALETIERAIAEHVVLQDSSSFEYGDSYRARGRILAAMGRFADANVAYAQAKEMYSTTADSVGMSDVLGELGVLYAQIGLYDDSEGYFKERYRYVEGAPEIMKVSDLVNLGRNILMQQRYADAKANYKQALDMRPYANGFEEVEIYALNGLIEALYFNGDLQEIEPTFIEMDTLYHRLGARPDLDFLMNQSRFFRSLCKGEYAIAENIGRELYAASLAKQDASEVMLHAEFLAELYKKSENYPEAIRYLEIYTQARDSMLSANKTNALLLYRTQFETKEKELEIDKLAVEKQVEEAKSRAYLLIAGLLGALLLIGGGLYIQLRKTQAKLKVQNLELQSLNATKNKFFSIIAHDLGGPLVVFGAIGKRIRRQVAVNDIAKIAESADILSESSGQLSSLLDNLLKWALSENGVMPYHPEPIFLNGIITENVELFSETSKSKSIDVNYSISDELSIHADKDAVNTICRNLISNALKFTPSGGRVNLQAKAIGAMVELTCSDTGVGMDDKKLGDLFTQESRSERGTGGESGTGLGMILIKELAELNQGSVEVESKLNRGTVVRIQMPKASL